MENILVTLNKLSLLQMVLAWVFLGCYALALGGMLSAKGSLLAGSAALLSAVSFAAFSADWVHGVLLVLFAIGGMGLFVALSWALTFATAWFVQRGARTEAPAPAPQRAAPALPVAAALRALWRSGTAPR